MAYIERFKCIGRQNFPSQMEHDNSCILLPPPYVRVKHLQVLQHIFLPQRCCIQLRPQRLHGNRHRSRFSRRNISPYSILLFREVKCHKFCVFKIGLYGGCREDAAAAAECNTFEAEICAVGLGYGLISHTEEEEVCNCYHVPFGLENVVAQCT